MRFLAIVFLVLTSCDSPTSSFLIFVSEVEDLPVEQQQAAVDEFTSDKASFPYYESETSAVFLYRGEASSVSVAGDFTGWQPGRTNLELIGETDLWYNVSEFESDARLDYKIVVDDSLWILDPQNPNAVLGGFSFNSELAMPGYVQPSEFFTTPEGSTGKIDSFGVATDLPGGSRRVWAYTPADYDSMRQESYPVVIYHDGTDFVDIAGIQKTLDNLIAWGRIEPIVALFLDPVDRMSEFWQEDADEYEDFVVGEFMTWAEASYNISTDPAKRAVTGISLGGYVSAKICSRHPEVFGLCGPSSASFQINDEEQIRELSTYDILPIKYYVDWGTYETVIHDASTSFVEVLTEKGYEFRSREWHEGHSWGSWRAHQDDMLEYFFPGPGL